MRISPAPALPDSDTTSGTDGMAPNTHTQQRTSPLTSLTEATATTAASTQRPLMDDSDVDSNDDVCAGNERDATSASPAAPVSTPPAPYFQPVFMSTKLFYRISQSVPFFPRDHRMVVATWMGFWALLNVTCANYVLTPIRDAVALQVGVRHMPHLTLASSVLAFLSSVPIGWLFEAPDPKRRKVWKKMGLTRGETQGTSLALFYRFFALCLVSYAVGFPLAEWLPGKLGWNVSVGQANGSSSVLAEHLQAPRDLQNRSILKIVRAFLFDGTDSGSSIAVVPNSVTFSDASVQILDIVWREYLPYILARFGQSLYIAFFLVVHLMKLHSLSLVWGVTTEAMEYEEVAREQQRQKEQSMHPLQRHRQAVEQQQQQHKASKPKTRLQRLGLVGFGGTVGGVMGSVLASLMARVLHLSGLLLLSALLLEVAAQLSIELGRIMQYHWVQQQSLFVSTNDLAGLDHSMRRSTSFGSMKRVASGNSVLQMRRVNSSSSTSLNGMAGNGTYGSSQSLQQLSATDQHVGREVYTDAPVGGNLSHGRDSTMAAGSSLSKTNGDTTTVVPEPIQDDNTFSQRLLRGITTILKSRLLMAVFTYNALYASTTTLLSFQRATLVANRNVDGASSASSIDADTAFLAKINIASSVAVFVMQASGLGALVAQAFGPQGSLALMPAVRLFGVVSLAWWHRTSGGKPPNLVLFLLLDECTRVINLAVAKPVRESLWRGLSNEARYEAKPIVDTLANRWGGGSAAFMVSMVNRLISWAGLDKGGADARVEAVTADVDILGFPPVVFLCLIVAVWWTMVSVDLGRVRKRIDVELKKRQ